MAEKTFNDRKAKLLGDIDALKDTIRNNRFGEAYRETRCILKQLRKFIE